MNTILIALHQQAVARECRAELPLPEPNHGQRFAVLYVFALVALAVAILVVEGSW